MEFTVDKKTLENAMTNIVSVAPAKAIKPILSSVLIECSDAVYLYATDMETSIRIKLEGASAQSPGKTAVDAKTLFEIAKNAPSAQLNIKQENEATLDVYSNGGVANIPMLDPEDFPALIFDSTAEPIELIPTLSSEIDRVIYAIAADPMMRALNGLHFESVDGHLRFVTADGFRLATIDTAQPIPDIDAFTIPLGGAKIFLSFLKRYPARVKLYNHITTLGIESPENKVIIRKLDLQYPDYRRVIGATHKTTVTVDRDALIKTIKFARVVTAEAKESVLMSVANKELVFTARSTGKGAMNVSVPCAFEGPALKIAYNPDYFLESAQHVKGGDLTIQLGTPADIMRLEDGNASHYIMPIRSTEV